MALEEVIKSINLDAKKKAEVLLERAASESEKVIREAKEKAASDLEKAKSEAESDAKSEKERAMLSKRMELNREYYRKLNSTINETKTEMREHANELRNGETYGKLLGELYRRAVSQLGEGCVVHARPEDLRSISASKSSKLVPDNSIVGGIICSSEDGSVGIDYSLNGIMDKLNEGITLAVSESATRGEERPNAKKRGGRGKKA